MTMTLLDVHPDPQLPLLALGFAHLLPHVLQPVKYNNILYATQNKLI